jgi:hypothetical protein
MKKILLSLPIFAFLAVDLMANLLDSLDNIVLEPWTYTENFEDRDLGAWASYPLWQDNAYDQNFRVNEIIPGDPNISIVQKVTPYTNVDNYAGAQKLLDMYLVPGAKISFRYYLKTNENAEFVKVRFAAGEYGKIDVSLPDPEENRWVSVTVGFDDFVRENQSIADKEKVRIYALAFLTKIPNADPDMPIYLGLDDIKFEGKRLAAFQFAEPSMDKLPEFEPYIPKKHFTKGEDFNLNGYWPIGAKKVTLEIVSFTNEDKIIYKKDLKKRGELWSLKPLKLSFPDGLYIGKLTAYNGSALLSSTKFTIHIAPKLEEIAGKHPRLLYDAEKKSWLKERFKEERFKLVYDKISEDAKNERESIPVESLIFDLDQFPDEDWLPTWSAWGSRIYHTAGALRSNAMAYAFHDDQEAGIYAKDVLLKLAEWPNWTHPWQTKRGRFSEHRTGSWSHRVAEAYDLTYDLMTPEERKKIRKAIMDNIVEGAHRTYVYNDNITSKTSNWLAMIVGGSLMNMAAIYGDGPDTENLEPYFTGAMIKYYTFLNRVTDSKDGAWGEGLGYNSYSFSNIAYSVPSINNVFNINLSSPLIGTYKEYIWGGLVKNRQWFEYGDSGGNINPVNNWAFLLDMHQEPRLGWFYNYLKGGEAESNTQGSNSDVGKEINNNQHETFQDVLYDTKNVPQDSPFDESPIKAFREVGTTVFKSGWETDDFVFVMRTGPFFNHQHLDQGSFWLADRGEIFIEERHLKNSTYYDDPLYQPWLIQPVAHSTILINGNHQSQRVGDPLKMAPGFNDHAFIAQFLDGENAAFSSGDIGRLYWGKIKSLTRNVLYLKPRTVLMLDVAVPNKTDADVTLLYQTLELEDIKPDQKVSKIVKDKATLNMIHLSPENFEVTAVETPHYLKTLLNDRPLKREGMLTVTGRTDGDPLVLANILTTTVTDTATPDVESEAGDGFISGTASGQNFAFTTNPGKMYNVENFETDALAITWDETNTFVSMATEFKINDLLILKSKAPITFEYSNKGIKFYCSTAGEIYISSKNKPSSVILNGKSTKNFKYDNKEKVISIDVPEGEGFLVINLSFAVD